MNRNKYLVGLIGLALGFIAGFFVTQSINRSGAGAAAAPGTSGVQGKTSGQQGQQGMMADVQATLERAKNNPSDFEAQIEAARKYYQIGRVGETVEYLLKAYELNPAQTSKLGAFPLIGQWYFEQKKYEEAETWFRRAIETDPKDPDVFVILAETLNLRTPPDPTKAIQELQNALKIDPKNGHAFVHLIDAYLLKKDARLADEMLAKLKEVDPANQKIASYQASIADLKAGRPVTLPKE